mgnify:CR=1 FL=1
MTLEAVRRAEVELNGRGRVILRPSGTEPLVRVYAEASSEELRDALLAEGDRMVNG